MAEVNNPFAMLDEDEVAATPQTAHADSTSATADADKSSAAENGAETEEGGWTEVQSHVKETKPTTTLRRLVPQWTLSRDDLGNDRSIKQVSGSSLLANAIGAGSGGAAGEKRKVRRFQKDALLSLRRPTKILESMTNPALTGIVTEMPSKPITLEPFDSEEFNKIWQQSLDKSNRRGFGDVDKNAKRNGTRDNRDRDRKPGENMNDSVLGAGWSRGASAFESGGSSTDMWDDPTDPSEGSAAGTGMGDLSDLCSISAAAMRFEAQASAEGGARAPSNGGGALEEEIEKYDAFTDDTMAEFMREQEAKDSDKEKAAQAAADGAASMRSKLLSTLNIKPITSTTAASISSAAPVQVETQPQVQTQTQTQTTASAEAGDLLLGVDPSRIFGLKQSDNNVPAPVAAAAPQVVMCTGKEEWFYCDPNQVIQGPFDTVSMRKWLDAGYFKHDLPIRLKHWQSFYPLGLLYPDPTLAFQSYSAIDPAYLLPPGHPLHLPKPQQQAVPPQHSLQHQMQQQELQRQRAMEQQREQLRQQEQAQQQAQQQREQQQREMIQREQQRINQQREQQLLEQQRQQQMLQEQSKRAAEEAQRHQQQHQQILNDQKSRVSNLLQEQQQRLQQQRSQASQQQQTLPMHGQPQPTKKQSKNAPQTLAQQAQQLAQQQQAQQQAMQQAMQQALQQQQQQQQAAPTAPWIGAKGAQGPSLAEIQQQEQMQMSAAQRQAQAEQARRGLKNGLPWGGESAGAGAGKNQQQAYQNNLAAIQQAEAAAANSAAAQQKAERDRQHKANQKADQKMILQRQAEIEKVRKGWSATGSDAAMGSHDSNNLSAIMAEEQRVLQSKRQAANSQGQSTGAHSWAAKIGTPTGGFYTESHAANAIDFPPVSATAPTPAPVAAPAAAPKQQQKQKAAAAAPAAPQAVAIPPNMSAEMAEFCISSLTKLGQNVDLTLPSFCLGSVESSTEVREYFSDYYGSTPAVSQFATEFIRRKEKGSGPGKGKKGKK